MNYQRIDDQDMLCVVECASARTDELLGEIHRCTRPRDSSMDSRDRKTVSVQYTAGSNAVVEEDEVERKNA